MIILLAAVIRLYNLGKGDVISDEALYVFRSIGYLDFTFATEQPSTVQLLKSNNQTWTKLSFHDHPPLVFLSQYWFIKLFNPDIWAARFLSALLGLASLFLIYLIGKKLFSEKIGLIATAIATVNVLLIYVSRTAVQEAQVIFFILLAVYAFLRAQESNKWYLIWGLVLGFGLLTKYTLIYIIPAMLFYLIFYKRSAFKNKYLYLGVLLAIVVFSPVLIYNLKLYQNFGHFDFQISHVLGQNVSYWQAAPGKEIGSIGDRFLGIFRNLWLYNSWLFNLLALVSLFSLIFYCVRRKEKQTPDNHIFLLAIILINLLFYLVIGPGVRFLTMIIPWLSLAAAVLFDRTGKVGLALLLLLLVWEAVFSINSYLLDNPVGRDTLCFSKIHWDMHPWGFNELDAYLDNVYQNKYPSITVPYNFQFLEDIKEQAIADMKGQHYRPAGIIVVYDDDMDDLASLWVLGRRSLYQAWPILTLVDYQSLLNQYGKDELRSAGVTDFYFIRPTDKVLLKEPGEQSALGYGFEQQLKAANIVPEIIYNSRNEKAFKIYHYN